MPKRLPSILLVEGDIIARNKLADYLRDCHFRVFEAANGDEAIPFLRTPEIPIDVVLANTMATGNWSSFTQRINAESPSAELIFAGPMEKAVAHGVRPGGVGSGNEDPPLATPYVYRLVLDRVHQALTQHAGQDAPKVA
jgi:DNA-binding response OmpR family regulator